MPEPTAVTRFGRGRDAAVPALTVKIGPYPLHHGGVGAIRSLARLGVPVYAITEGRSTPAALSRYLRGAIVWPTNGLEDAGQLVAGLKAAGREVAARSQRDGCPAGPIVAIPTDDEAAILLAEHAGELQGLFAIADVPPGLPRTLADKNGLAELCAANGIPSPRSRLPESAAELLATAEAFGYPVVVKNAQPWTRLRRPGVGSSTVVADREAMAKLIAGWGAGQEIPTVLVQEFVAGGAESDWVVNVYCDRRGDPARCFTGVKVRCWPAAGGVGSLLYAVRNDAIAAMTADLCRRVGYRGVADLDWRVDARHGGYRLLDFNPRLGAQFALFRNDQGIDVARALYLDLSGKEIPTGPQVYGRGLRVEHLDVPAALAARAVTRRAAATAAADGPAGVDGGPPISVPWYRIRLAWLSPADPLPAAAAAVRAVRPAAAMARRLIHQRRRDQGTAPPPGKNW